MIDIHTYDDKYVNDWENIVDLSANGTFLNSRKFLNYHPPDRFKDSSLLISKHNQLIAVLPACEINISGQKHFISHPGSTYGGLVFKKNSTTIEINTVITHLESYLKGRKYNQIILKQTPHIFCSAPSQSIDFLLTFNGYFAAKTDLSTAIDLADYSNEDDVLARCNSKTRNQCRLGYKNGLDVRCTSDFSAFHDILSNNLEQHRTKPVHTAEELRILTEIFPDNISLYGAFCDNSMIAGCLAFKFNNRVFHTQYLAMNYEYKHLAPMNYLIMKLITIAATNSYKYFNFGISTDKEGVNWSLFKFKEGFGGGGVLLNTYQKDFIY